MIQGKVWLGEEKSRVVNEPQVYKRENSRGAEFLSHYSFRTGFVQKCRNGIVESQLKKVMPIC